MRAPWVTAWGEDHWSWNHGGVDEDDEDGGDGSGRPGRMLVASAIEAWRARIGDVSADVVAEVFRLPVELVHDALSERARPADMPTALQVWSMLRGEPSSIIEAASLFSMMPSEVIREVESHYWMLIETSGIGLVIGHEGE